MAKKRFIVEFGTGVDVHGMNVTKAAKKALRDAISHCSMTGLSEIFGIPPIDDRTTLDIVIAAPFKDQVDVKEALTGLPPYKNVNVSVVPGGLTVEGVYAPDLGKGRTIIIVNAALTVWIDV